MRRPAVNVVILYYLIAAAAAALPNSRRGEWRPRRLVRVHMATSRRRRFRVLVNRPAAARPPAAALYVAPLAAALFSRTPTLTGHANPRDAHDPFEPPPVVSRIRKSVQSVVFFHSVRQQRLVRFAAAAAAARFRPFVCCTLHNVPPVVAVTMADVSKETLKKEIAGKPCCDWIACPRRFFSAFIPSAFVRGPKTRVLRGPTAARVPARRRYFDRWVPAGYNGHRRVVPVPTRRSPAAADRPTVLLRPFRGGRRPIFSPGPCLSDFSASTSLAKTPCPPSSTAGPLDGATVLRLSLLL